MAIDFNNDFTMTIAGRSVASANIIEVVNPANASTFATAPDCTQALLDEAVAAANAAFPGWCQTEFTRRQILLREAADRITSFAGELTRLFTREHGRPLEGAREEIEEAAGWLRAVADMELPVQIIGHAGGQQIEVRRVPLGAVCAIAPWNYPVLLAAWKIAPALLCGNTVVLKPSPYTPLCTLKIGEILKDVFPPGVLNVVSGGDSLGPWMTAHPGFAKISFTGSTATGKAVMANAAADLKSVTLELGGNDAAIILPDVDVDAVAEAIFFGAFANTGQICVATKRLYVHEAIYDALLDRLTALARSMKTGDGADPDTVFGPLQNRRQSDFVQGLIADSRARGLTIIEGSAVPLDGFFVPVTLVDNPPEDTRIVQEEAFGPVLPILKFSGIDEVIQRVNASPYGLAASVWSGDESKAKAIAQKLETGTVWINQNLNLRPDVPMAGHKLSGLGIENGPDGLLQYTRPQATYLAPR